MYCMPLRKFKEETGRPDCISCPSCLEALTARNLSLAHGSSTYTCRKVTFHQTPQEENDPKGCETRPSIYYKPKFIYKAATQLVKLLSLFYHTIIFVFLCGSQQEISTENWPGKIWKLQLRMLTPLFHSSCHIQRKVGPQQITSAQILEFHRQENIFKELGN